MIPDDQVCVTIVDLRKVRGFVLIKMRSSPLDVSSASHQRRHRPLNSLVFSFGFLGCHSSVGTAWFLSQGSGLGHGRGTGSGGNPR